MASNKQAQRKPYHITKQREKWKVEEHDKFVEALELYGRGWPQITEYVGTKTIAQIRSHAQKFFKKLALPLPRLKTKPSQQPCTPRKNHGTIEDDDQELKKTTKSSPSCSSASSCIKLFGITMATSSGSSSSSSSHVGGATGRDMTLLNLLV